MSRGPGHWQRAVLGALVSQPVILAGDWFRSRFGRPLTRAEGVAMRRAVRQLERRGLVETALLWWQDKIVLAVGRPGATLGGKPLSGLNVARVPSPAHPQQLGTFKGSLRDIARHEGVSVAQVRRDLAEAKRKAAAKPEGKGGRLA